MPVSIHLLEPKSDQIAQIQAIEVSCFGENNLSRDQALGVLSSPEHRVMVAVSGSRVVGFCEGFFLVDVDGPRLELDFLGVLPAFRGRGLGTRLIGAVIDVARAEDVARCHAAVRVGNRASLRAFARNGLVPLGRPRDLCVYDVRDEGPGFGLTVDWTLKVGRSEAAGPTWFTSSDLILVRDGETQGAATAIPVASLSGRAVWIEKIATRDSEVTIAFARGVVDLAARWGVARVGALVARSDRGDGDPSRAESFSRAGYQSLGRYHVLDTRDGALT